MAETRRVRRGAEQLLLLAALLLGLVTMHTLGHEPLGHGAATAQTAPMATTSPLSPMASADHDHAGQHTGPHTPPHHSGHSGHSGGPLAVCLAVLGALVVVLGGVALRRARRAGWARLRAAGVRWCAGRRAPPLPITVLDRVAVLRI
ncbi:DUF6153 family protein [Streptomyces sp. NPDC101160]|uniref:DUF6153 family protein n=1 Tax=Streptomyces sp. NPDC101160 TaxID=3366118 RepID=UPI003805EE42